MPLIKSKSKRAFDENLKSEMSEGRPLDQSLAIAYDVQRRNRRKKYAEGGQIAHDSMIPKSRVSEIMSRRRKKYAEGGQADIELNNDEMPNEYYHQNEDYALDWRMDEDFEDMEQPMDSNLIDDPREEAEENKHGLSMVDSIRRKRSMK